MVTAIDEYAAVKEIIPALQEMLETCPGETAIGPGKVGIGKGGFFAPGAADPKGEQFCRNGDLFREIAAVIAEDLLSLRLPFLYIGIAETSGNLSKFL